VFSDKAEPLRATAMAKHDRYWTEEQLTIWCLHGGLMKPERRGAM
jgi:hypothetical protein